ncbi:MAG: hypothetical protein ABSE20_17100 [Acetobacteraceae bacterium]
MSISSLQSSNWIPPYIPQSANGSSQNSPTAQFAGSIPQTNGSSATQANPFQQLAANVQAVLVQGQSATATTAASSTTTDPAQQLATDLQTIYAQLQATQSGGDAGGQTPPTGQENATEPAQPHHHHHHEPSATASTTSPSPAAASGNTPNVSQALAADMMRALQAYASSSSATTLPGLTV